MSRMSVLNTIKGKIVTVQQDISHGLRSLTTKESTGNVNATVDNGVINFDAGADLLQRYQQYWSELHHASENNAKQAQEVGILVAKIFQFFEKQNLAMNQFLSEVSAIQLLIVDLADAKDKISKLEESFGQVEMLLLELEDACDQNEMQKRRLEHEYQLAKYRQCKSLELEKNKGTMAAKHASKVQQFEAHVMATLKERSKVFDDAFHEQLENYKKTGRVEVLPSPTQSPASKPDLADIGIEDDPAVLDEFLDGKDQATGSSGPDVVQIERLHDSDKADDNQIDKTNTAQEEGFANKDTTVCGDNLSTNDALVPRSNNVTNDNAPADVVIGNETVPIVISNETVPIVISNETVPIVTGNEMVPIVSENEMVPSADEQRN